MRNRAQSDGFRVSANAVIAASASIPFPCISVPVKGRAGVRVRELADAYCVHHDSVYSDLIGLDRAKVFLSEAREVRGPQRSAA